jgi:WD40 repeat protein
MKWFYTLFLVVSFCFLSLGNCFGQFIQVFNVDSTDYPIMRAKFYSFDQNGYLITDFSASDFELRENSKLCNIRRMICPSNYSPDPVSVVLSLDLWGNQFFNWEHNPGTCMDTTHFSRLKNIAKTLVDSLSSPLDEFRIQFGGSGEVAYFPITNDKTLIKSDLDNAFPVWKTDPPPDRFICCDPYNKDCMHGSAFIGLLMDYYCGAFKIVKSHSLKSVVVVFSVGWGHPLPEGDLHSCIDYCKSNNIIFYSCFTTRDTFMPYGIKSSLKTLADSTGGRVFDGIMTDSAATSTALILKTLMQGSSQPCNVEWESESSCIEGYTIELKLKKNGSYNSITCPQPSKMQARMEFNPYTIKFLNIPPGTELDTTITIKAINGDFEVSDIKSSNPKFDIPNKNFTLKNGDSINLTVSFMPSDSGYVFTTFTVVNNKCPAQYIVSGGYLGKEPAKKTLKVTFPNGGEILAKGGDTIITWEGIPPTDTVKLEYSLDSAKNWLVLTRNATNLKYKWRLPKAVSKDCLVRVKQLPDGPSDTTLFINTMSEFNLGVWSVKWSPDNVHFITGSQDGLVEYWDAKSGKIIKYFTGHTDAVNSVCLSNDALKIYSGSWDWTIKTWNISSGNIIKTFHGDEKILSMDLSPDGSKIASTENNKIKIWNVNSGSLDKVITIRKKPKFIQVALCVKWSPDQTKIANGSYDQWYTEMEIPPPPVPDDFTIWIYDGIKGNLVNSLTGHMGQVWSVDWNPKGTKVVSGSFDNTIKIWDAQNGNILFNLTGHTKRVGSVRWSPDGLLIASGSDDCTIKIWNAFTGDLIYTITSDGGRVPYVDWSPDGTRIASTYTDGFVKVWTISKPPIQLDVSDSIFSIIAPIIASIDVDMKLCFIGGTKDSLINGFLTNTGSVRCRIDSIYFDGVNKDQFQLVSGLPLMILPGKSQPVDFRFMPNSIGIKTAQIKIITQTDTLTQTIRGEGIREQLQISGNIIDFGKVIVDSEKDTTIGSMLTNIGYTPVTISKITNNGPDKSQFVLKSSSGPFTLSPGQSMNVKFSFSPVKTGKVMCIIQVDFDGIGSPGIIRLFGEGVWKAPKLTILYPVNEIDLKCETEKTGTVSIKNSGNDTLKVQNAQFSNSEFSFGTPFSQFSLAPNDVHGFVIKYTPLSSGFHNSYLTLWSNSKPDSVITIQLAGYKDSSAVKTSVSTIDFGVLLYNETKDTTFTIRNTGVSATGYLTVPDGFTTDFMTFSLLKAETKEINLHFKGIAKDTTIRDTLYITDSICSGKNAIILTVRIRHNKNGPILTVVQTVNPFNPICTKEDIELLTIQNTGDDTLKITDGQLTSPEFSFVPAFTSVSLAPDSIYSFEIKFTSNDIGYKTSDLIIKSNSIIDSILTVELSAFKDSIQLAPVLTEIDLGILKDNQTKDTTFIIQNLGTLTTGGYLILPDYFTSADSSFILPRGDTTGISLHFAGYPNDTVITDTLKLIDEICNFENSIIINLRIHKNKTGPHLIVLKAPSSMNLSCDSKKTDTLTLMNSGDDTLKIYEAGFSSPEFRFVSGFSSISIPAGSTINLIISYIPVNAGIIEADLIIRSNSVIDSVLTLHLTGIKDSVSLRASTNILDLGILSPNESKDTIFSVQNTGNMTTTCYLMTPTGFEANKSSFSIPKNGTEQISLHFDGYEKDTIIIDSLIITDSICNRNDIIIIKVQIKSIPITQTSIEYYPNPASHNIEFIIGLNGSGHSELIISDFLGKMASKIFEANESGTYRVNYDLALLSNGVYFYTLRTPAGRLSGLFFVVK